VKRAQGIFQALRGRCSSESNDNVPELFLLHGQLRLHEKDRIFNDFKSEDNKNKGKILISTQVIEAGVDISVPILITELAPWSSIVQRFGRLNRYGENDNSTAIWIDIKPDKRESNSIILPYSDEEFNAARSRLEQLSEVSPQTLGNVVQPQVETQRHVIRSKDLVDLFDTTPDLTGNDIDISRFIRDSGDRNVYVYWRDWKGDKPQEDSPGPSKDELCQAPIADFRDFYQKKKEQVWLWDYLEGHWIHPNDTNVHPGQTFLIHSNAGGYDTTIGWLSDCKDYVPPVISVTEFSSKRNDHTGDDQGVVSRKWETIATHAANTLKQMETLLDSLKPVTLEYGDILKTAAYYHDIGKAHDVVQEAMLSTINEDEKGKLNNYLWAKSGHSGRIRYKRKHFRHELASALILLQNSGVLGDLDTNRVNLIAYLIASHHGKVRLSIRSVPGETVPNNYDTTRFARGIWDGDVIPEIDLGGGVNISTTVLDLSLMEVGTDEHGNPSWLERMCKLRDNRDLGPFRLAYLEGLVRIADWRASSLQEGESNE
jgi:CRISPR-associated endonuclease Cas3-HD